VLARGSGCSGFDALRAPLVRSSVVQKPALAAPAVGGWAAPALRAWALALALAVLAGVGARAQEQPPVPTTLATASIPASTPAPRQDQESPAPLAQTGFRSLFRDLVQDVRHLPSLANLEWALAGGGLALAVHPADPHVNRHLLGKAAAHRFFLAGSVIGNGYVQVAGALGTYAVGRLAGAPAASHVGMDLLRAEMLAGALTYGLKLSVRRERPDGSNRLSFPSAHASATFATATVLQRRVGWRWSVPLFLVASYTSASRLHDNVHYLSDVVAGAACGVIAGRTATWDGKRRYTVIPVVSRGRAAVLVTWETRR
jgi:membrane-associated phospholipid phosphatase